MNKLVILFLIQSFWQFINFITYDILQDKVCQMWAYSLPSSPISWFPRAASSDRLLGLRFVTVKNPQPPGHRPLREISRKFLYSFDPIIAFWVNFNVKTTKLTANINQKWQLSRQICHELSHKKFSPNIKL